MCDWKTLDHACQVCHSKCVIEWLMSAICERHVWGIDMRHRKTLDDTCQVCHSICVIEWRTWACVIEWYMSAWYVTCEFSDMCGNPLALALPFDTQRTLYSPAIYICIFIYIFLFICAIDGENLIQHNRHTLVTLWERIRPVSYRSIHTTHTTYTC